MKTTDESFDDIVFENRNKAYGAYELRKKYSKRGALAFVISIFILFTAVGVPLIASIMERNDYKRYIEKTSITELENIKKEKLEVVPPPPPPPPASVKEIKFVAPIVVDKLTDEEIELASNDELAEYANNQAVDTASYELVIVEKKEDIIIDSPVELFAVQEKPAYPGGDAAGYEGAGF